MLGFIIMILVISSIMGNQTEAKKLLRGMFTVLAVVYGIRILLLAGFQLLPVLIISWAVTNIVIPFVKGFASRFEK